MLDAAVASAAPRSIGRSASQLTGLAGLGFVTFVVIQNLALTSGAPMGDASVADVASFYQDAETRLAVATALAMINLPLLAIFVSGFHARLRDTPAAASRWPVIAVIGGALLAVTFGIVSAINAVLVANADVLEEQPILTQFVWDLHSSVFSVNTVMLGILLAGVARAAQLGGLAPAWQTWVGLAGAALLIASSTATVAVIDGSPIGLLGLAGFLCWLVWLATASVRFLREEPA